ncbi:MAG: hypothetical protein ACK557_16630, partial [Planctomycetota bacterium]
MQLVAVQFDRATVEAGRLKRMGNAGKIQAGGVFEWYARNPVLRTEGVGSNLLFMISSSGRSSTDGQRRPHQLLPTPPR